MKADARADMIRTASVFPAVRSSSILKAVFELPEVTADAMANAVVSIPTATISSIISAVISSLPANAESLFISFVTLSVSPRQISASFSAFSFEMDEPFSDASFTISPAISAGFLRSASATEPAFAQASIIFLFLAVGAFFPPFTSNPVTENRSTVWSGTSAINAVSALRSSAFNDSPFKSFTSTKL